jgi:hypothetical protein
MSDRATGNVIGTGNQPLAQPASTIGAEFLEFLFGINNPFYVTHRSPPVVPFTYHVLIVDTLFEAGSRISFFCLGRKVFPGFEKTILNNDNIY